MLESTGERLVPAASHGELVHAEHLARYRLAARLAGERRVLDAACGEGYGCALMAAAGARSVVGVDIDAATIEHAGASYGLDFRVADVAALPFADGVFDLVTSFETIEHVRDPERALDELARVLADDGVLLISTPNVAEYLEDNPFHVREFLPEEFAQALGARFPHVARLYQQNFIAAAILDAERLALDDAGRAVPLDAAKVAGVAPERALYLIAVCSRRPLPALAGDVAVLADVYEAHELAAERRAWQERAHEAERQNAELRWTLDSTAWRLIQPLRRLGSALRGGSRSGRPERP
ncbi:MAG TPA: class I SAM-dependent methyltransferase [Solirubrobacteraceae bacterium]